MIELVIGCDGFIGGRLHSKIESTGAVCLGTTRRRGEAAPKIPASKLNFLDLLDIDQLPFANVVYICAGTNGAKTCEGNPESHRVNVDATAKLAKHYSNLGAFTVWISSTTVEWSNSAYARQKAMTEAILMNVPRVGIVRAGRVLLENVNDLCDTLINVGHQRVEGLTLWGTDERPYAR